MIDKELIDSYMKVLDDPEKNENDIQRFLEDNTQLIPLPIIENHNLHMNAVISKFRLGNEAVTDFLYITKSTVLWKVVLIELENQHKRIFKGVDAEFTADFTKGINQIQSWQVYIDDNKGQILKQLEKLRQPTHMSNNPTYFEYVLVMGRNSELTEKRNKMLGNLMEREHIKVMSYDSLISRYTNFSGVDREKIVLSPWREQGYSIKYLPKGGIDTSLFTYLPPEYLNVSKEQEEQLVGEGYEIGEWRKGFSLVKNNKHAVDPLLNQKFRFDGGVVKA